MIEFVILYQPVIMYNLQYGTILWVSNSFKLLYIIITIGGEFLMDSRTFSWLTLKCHVFLKLLKQLRLSTDVVLNEMSLSITTAPKPWLGNHT